MMGNDGVGIVVGEALKAMRPDLDVADGGLGGLSLIPLIEGCDAGVIVDATCGMGARGTVTVFRDIPPSTLFPLSLHDVGIAETLEIARAIGITTRVAIVGIEGGEITSYRAGLDPDVEASVPRACGVVLSMIHEFEKA
jgi:hydrogenase maturation protease